MCSKDEIIHYCASLIAACGPVIISISTPPLRSGVVANSVVAVDRAAHKDWKGAAMAGVGAVSAGLGK
jgi:hypothetical protein